MLQENNIAIKLDRLDVRSIAKFINAPYKPRRKKAKLDFYAASFRRS